MVIPFPLIERLRKDEEERFFQNMSDKEREAYEYYKKIIETAPSFQGGYMEPGDIVHPPLYPHTCTKCRYSENYTKRYPY